MSLREFPVAQSSALRILLIDSDPIHLDVWSALLSYVGYEVVAVRNCFEASLRFAERFHCIILEHNLPDMSGLDFVRHFSSPIGPSFVLLTSDDRPSVHLSAMEAGASVTLVKPSSVHDVVEAVEQACWKVPHVAPLHYQGRMTA